MPRQGKLSIERMCQLAGVSRAGLYRSLQTNEPMEEEMEVRSAIQQSSLSTGDATATDASAKSFDAAACWSTTSAWHG
jgi:hypothetical protein